MRVKQPAGTHGSLHWMQRLVNENPVPLENQLRAAVSASPDVAFSWKSPLLGDDYAEYRDGGFLTKLGFDSLSSRLAAFWPSRGPQWDALATSSDAKVFLLEAKAHAGELASSCDASEPSRRLIDNSIAAAKAYFKAPEQADWCNGYYQYANRLAHLYFLREIGQVDAHLVFLYLVNDTRMGGPESAGAWAQTIASAHKGLGLGTSWSHPAVHDVFLNVAEIGAPAVGP